MIEVRNEGFDIFIILYVLEQAFHPLDNMTSNGSNCPSTSPTCDGESVHLTGNSASDQGCKLFNIMPSYCCVCDLG